MGALFLAVVSVKGSVATSVDEFFASSASGVEEPPWGVTFAGSRVGFGVAIQPGGVCNFRDLDLFFYTGVSWKTGTKRNQG